MTPDVLAFADKRTDGAFEVAEPSGAVVARIEVPRWTSTSFEAANAFGQPLCSGKRRAWWSGWWDVTDPADELVASMKGSLSGTRKRVLLPDERTPTLRGQWFGRDWSLCDEQGEALLSSEPTNSAWSFQPDAWVVRCHDASLTLAQVVGIVEINRLIVKAGNSSGAAASA